MSAAPVRADLKPAVLIVGATSDIALALARELAGQGHAIHLAGRDPAALEADRADLAIRARVPVSTLALDVTDLAGMEAKLRALDPVPHVIVSMVGFMGEQAQSEADPAKAAAVVTANFTGPAVLMEAGARLFAGINAPTTLVGVSSVAGDRGRARNYWYGAAKAGYTAMLSGLRQRLNGTNTTVITVKPGFVATRMTQGMTLPKPLVESAESCAKRIAGAIKGKRLVVYPWKWRLLMMVIRAVPEPIFKGMKF